MNPEHPSIKRIIEQEEAIREKYQEGDSITLENGQTAEITQIFGPKLKVFAWSEVSSGYEFLVITKDDIQKQPLCV